MNAFELVEAAARERLDRIRRLVEDLDAIRVECTDPAGAVTVSVDGRAGLLDLRLAEGIARMSPAEFERTVTETAAAAAREALGL